MHLFLHFARSVDSFLGGKFFFRGEVVSVGSHRRVKIYSHRRYTHTRSNRIALDTAYNFIVSSAPTEQQLPSIETSLNCALTRTNRSPPLEEKKYESSNYLFFRTFVKYILLYIYMYVCIYRKIKIHRGNAMVISSEKLRARHVREYRLNGIVRATTRRNFHGVFTSLRWRGGRGERFRNVHAATLLNPPGTFLPGTRNDVGGCIK